MKKANLLYGALAMLAFTACSDDKASRPDEVLNDGTESYITIRLMDANTINARANDFDNGNNDTDYKESLVNTITIAFFDANKNFITYSTDATPLGFGPTESTGGSLETKKEIKVKLTLRDDQALPAYAIAFANPIEAAPSLSNVASTQSSTRATFGNKNGSTQYFAMNNSVYFNDKGEMQVAVPVSTKNFYKGDNDTKAEAVDFYVERIAGKVVLKGNGDNGSSLSNKASEMTVNDGTEDGSKKYIVFVPEKWGLNAVEKTTYLMKNFQQSFSTLETNLQWATGTIWNDEANKRSYWAHSCTWNENSFPDVSDDVTTDATFKLKYVTYKEIATNGTAFGQPAYTLENTKKRDAYNKNSALVSAVVIGHYEIRDDQNTPVAPETGKALFYRRSGNLYTPAGYMSLMASLQQMIGTVTGTESSLSFTALEAAELEKYVEVYHPTKNSLGGKVKENLVTIKVKESADLSDLYIRVAENDYKKFGESGKTKADLNNYLLSVCGLTEAYTEGKAFFNVPIEHLGQKIENNPSAGFYGIVRNHTYEINITAWAEAAFGTGIFDETKPIVPDTSTDEYNFKANFNVNAWRIVNKNVTLGQ
ncbi:fimbria major subunit [uncultured Muribaculum sp.]|uniref:fimbria major subunit n=1 Tax=uncultured Muribaculum sp. TaxID=1918613 RepID=UPI00259284AE|nr:fimbria major subunit [uncultured Muribaculum sp.]